MAILKLCSDMCAHFENKTSPKPCEGCINSSEFTYSQGFDPILDRIFASGFVAGGNNARAIIEMQPKIIVDKATHSRFVDYCQFNGSDEIETLGWLMDEAREAVLVKRFTGR